MRVFLPSVNIIHVHNPINNTEMLWSAMAGPCIKYFTFNVTLIILEAKILSHYVHKDTKSCILSNWQRRLNIWSQELSSNLLESKLQNYDLVRYILA